MRRTPREEIIKRIEEKGPISFTEFMDVALYFPDNGYYMRRDSVWGGEPRPARPMLRMGSPGCPSMGHGDYITSLDISPIFSRMLAVEIYEMWLRSGESKDFHLIEAGAGRGHLIEGIKKTIARLYPDFSNTLRISVVEKNPNMKNPLFNFYASLDEIPCPFVGCIISNELIDSMPFHRVARRIDGLREIYTDFRDGKFMDVEDSPSTPDISEYFSSIGILPPLDAAVEVNINAMDWIKKAGSLLKKGFVVTIDYGMPARQLYAEERRAGTLLCHYRHTLNDDPYQNVGMQDITSHVDFTALKLAGESVGLEATGFSTQTNFFLALGILDELNSCEPILKDYETIVRNQGIKTLVMPGGIGGIMKVFIQHKGIEDPRLKGFSFKDRSGCL